MIKRYRHQSRLPAPKLLVVDSNDSRLASDLRSPRLCVVVFYQDNCQQSKLLFQHLRTILPKLEVQIKLIRCLVNESITSCAYHKVIGTPTILLVKDNKQIDRLLGAIPANQLLDRLNHSISA